MNHESGMICRIKKGKFVLVIRKAGGSYECLMITEGHDRPSDEMKIVSPEGDLYIDVSGIMSIPAGELKKTGRILERNEFQKVMRLLINRYAELFFNDSDVGSESKYVSSSGKKLDAGDLSSMINACLDMNLTIGVQNEKFESSLKEVIGIPHCLTTNSGSSANLLALSALSSYRLGDRRLVQGDEIITLAASFPTTVTPIIQNGYIPVFIDLSIPAYNVSISCIEEAITRKTGAIILPHTLGNPFDIDAVKAIAGKHGLWLIEDNCEGLGSRYDSRFTGSFGDMSTFSFYPAHQITTGEGGAVMTADPILYEIMLSLRDWGRDCICLPGHDDTCGMRFAHEYERLPQGYDHKYVYSSPGYNLRMTDIQAALGFSQMKKLERFTAVRKKNFSMLYEGLKKFAEYLILPETALKGDPSWFGFPLTVKRGNLKRSDLVNFLEKNNIGTRPLFAGNILRHPLFVNGNYKLRIADSGILISSQLTRHDFAKLENTELALNGTFWIGLWHGLTKKDIERVIRKFEAFFENL